MRSSEKRVLTLITYSCFGGSVLATVGRALGYGTFGQLANLGVGMWLGYRAGDVIDRVERAVEEERKEASPYYRWRQAS